jgi:hypothetical protein
MEEVSNLITQKLETMVTNDQAQIRSKRKAINALFLYAVRPGRSGKQRMADMSLRAAMVSNSEEFIWDRAKPFITRLSNTQGPPSLDWVIIIASPHVAWDDGSYDRNTVIRWAEAAEALPYAEDVSRSVIDALLHIASVNSLRPHIPVGIWTWLKEQPSLPPECSGRSRGSSGDVVRQVRELGDIDILKSYLLLVWSEWDPLTTSSLEVSWRCRPQSGRTLVELRCGATDKI